MSSTIRTFLLWLLMMVVVVFVWSALRGGGSELPPEISFNEFQEMVAGGRVESVVVRGRDLDVRLDGGDRFQLYLPYEPDAGLAESLIADGVTVYGGSDADNPWLAIFLTFGPVAAILGLWIYFMRMLRNKSIAVQTSTPESQGRRWSDGNEAGGGSA